MLTRPRRLASLSVLLISLVLLAGCAGTKASVNTGDAKTNEGVKGFFNGFFALFGLIGHWLGLHYQAYYNPSNNDTYHTWWVIGLAVFIVIAGSILFGGNSYRGRRRLL